jgi:hypothetical protein
MKYPLRGYFNNFGWGYAVLVGGKYPLGGSRNTLVMALFAAFSIQVQTTFITHRTLTAGYCYMAQLPAAQPRHWPVPASAQLA